MTQLSLLPAERLDESAVTMSKTLGRALSEREVKCAPPRLFVAGDVSLLRSAPRVAVVGARP